MNGNFDINRLSSQIVKSSGGKITPKDIERFKKGDMSALFGALSENERQSLKRVLQNKSEQEKILSSDEAKRIIGNIKKENGRNG